jgi:hypothetical protein
MAKPVRIDLTDIVGALKRNGIHADYCERSHDCVRDHPGADVYHPPGVCTCWVESDNIEVSHR